MSGQSEVQVHLLKCFDTMNNPRQNIGGLDCSL